MRLVVYPLLAALPAITYASVGLAQTESETALLPLRILLSSSAQHVLPGTSCDDVQIDSVSGRVLKGSRKVGDILAMQLTEFSDGTNVIEGSCKGKAELYCTLHLRHASGEVVSSTDIHGQPGQKAAPCHAPVRHHPVSHIRTRVSAACIGGKAGISLHPFSASMHPLIAILYA